MPRNRVPRAVFGLLILMALTASTSWAAPRRSSGDVQPSDALARIWDTLTAVWTGLGCKIDPSGAPAGTDLGCKIDPNGATDAPAETDSGCKIDPHGACLPRN